MKMLEIGTKIVKAFDKVKAAEDAQKMIGEV